MASRTLEELIDKVNEVYACKKLGDNVHYVAPEIRPKIQSDQVLALLEVLFEELQQRQKV